MEKYALFQLYFVILQSSYTTKQKHDEKTIISYHLCLLHIGNGSTGWHRSEFLGTSQDIIDFVWSFVTAYDDDIAIIEGFIQNILFVGQISLILSSRNKLLII